MESKEYHKQNREAILKAIVSANRKLLVTIRKQLPNLTETQVYILLLLKLNYPNNEINIILGIMDSNIDEVYDYLREISCFSI